MVYKHNFNDAQELDVVQVSATTTSRRMCECGCPNPPMNSSR